jgi:hypothetical protein
MKVRHKLSRSLIETPPRRKPIRGGSHPGFPRSSDIDIAGARSDQKLAAIITPPANPSIRQNLLIGFFAR